MLPAPNSQIGAVLSECLQDLVADDIHIPDNVPGKVMRRGVGPAGD